MAERTRRIDTGAREPRGWHPFRGRAVSAVAHAAEEAFAEGRQSVSTELETAVLGGADIQELLVVLDRIRKEGGSNA